ncbi:TRAP transporter small permease [Salipiger sp. PrR002]|uniref:TRAP transporter small permease n=1 Tax=Salipiger sp. PrR002 TaxID=2706489 RepID=UPI0013BE75A8|nr:TRAP transporter small permease [Salipiger sp. PrR002]NDW02015.1 TRAP transporter small permease [Salipiger sp. PrR002]NDW59055.1 TRAP transporter small permease [Salipiger sp. PrR004]
MFTRIASFTNRLFLVLASVAIVLMAVQVTTDVVIRALFNSAVIGTLEVISYYNMVGLVFLSLGYVELTHQNIRVDLFAQYMPKTVQLALYLFSCLLGLVFFGCLGWQTLLDAIKATQRTETVMANFIFQIWPARWLLPVGFLGLVLALTSNFFSALARREPY